MARAGMKFWISRSILGQLVTDKPSSAQTRPRVFIWHLPLVSDSEHLSRRRQVAIAAAHFGVQAHRGQKGLVGEQQGRLGHALAQTHHRHVMPAGSHALPRD